MQPRPLRRTEACRPTSDRQVRTAPKAALPSTRLALPQRSGRRNIDRRLCTSRCHALSANSRRSWRQPATVLPEEQGHRCQPHEASVARGPGVRRTCEGLVGVEEPLQRRLNRVADVSKQRPLLARCPSCHQRTYRCIWSRASKPLQLAKLSARHSAIEVSSVHSPAAKSKGPPPTMSVTGSKVPGSSNSTVVPTASPTAKPTKQPQYRDWTFIGQHPNQEQIALGLAFPGILCKQTSGTSRSLRLGDFGSTRLCLRLAVVQLLQTLDSTHLAKEVATVAISSSLIRSPSSFAFSCPSGCRRYMAFALLFTPAVFGVAMNTS